MAAMGPAPTGKAHSPVAEGRPFWLVIIALWLAEATGSFETAMIYAAQRAATEDLGNPVLVGWLITSYLLIGAGAAALAGRLGDLFGRRGVLLLILGCGIAGSLLSAWAPTYALLLAGRCIQGVTGALLPLCIGITREVLPPRKVALGIGLMMSGASAGTAAGLVLGGLLVDLFAWHSIFLASAGFAVVTVVLTLLYVPQSPPSPNKSKVEWFGGVLFVPGILALLVPITYGPSWGLTDWRTLGSAAFGLALLAWWVRVSLRSEHPLFDVRLFANRQVAIGNGVTALVSLGALQVTLIFSFLLQAPVWTGIGLGASAVVAGLVKLPSNISSLAAGPLSGWLTSRGGGRNTMIAGGLTCIAGWLLAVFFHATILQLVLVLVVISFGTTVLFAVGPTIITAAVPHDRTSEAAGTMTVVRQAFMGIGAQLMTILLATETISQPGNPARFPTTSAFMLTFGAVIGLLVAATLLALLLPRNAGVEEVDPDPAVI